MIEDRAFLSGPGQRFPFPVLRERELSEPVPHLPAAAASPRRRDARQSFYAGVSSDRTNLSPFTKDYRGLALSCDFDVFEAREGTPRKKKKKKLKSFFFFDLFVAFYFARLRRMPAELRWQSGRLLTDRS